MNEITLAAIKNAFPDFTSWLAGVKADAAAKTWEAAAVLIEQYWSPDTAEQEEIISESAGLLRQQVEAAKGEQA